MVAALECMALSLRLRLYYIKPHGALYNDMMARPEVRAILLEAIASYHRTLPLMLQATPDAGQHREEADALGVPVLFEAFADRCYDDDGSLLSRRRPRAGHNRVRMLAQVVQLCSPGTNNTVNGKVLQLEVDKRCVHGDNPEGVLAIESIRALVDGN